MARKLLCMVALISLVLLVQASGSLATTYDLGPQGDASHWTWQDLYSGERLGQWINLRRRVSDDSISIF